MENNNFWLNSGADVELLSGGGPVLNLRSNNIGTWSGVAPTLSVGNMHIDPKLVPDPLGLAADSPLIDAGLDNGAAGTPALAFDGYPRVQGARPDIGAYESGVIFTYSFDPP